MLETHTVAGRKVGAKLTALNVSFALLATLAFRATTVWRHSRFAPLAAQRRNLV